MSASSPRLLIVDDIADNRIILSRRLVRRGFEVVEASGGREALALISQQSFDVVLLDIMMPDLDGVAVLKIVRETHSTSALPVIMVTANGQSADTVMALTLGANDYVTKPVDFPVVLARIEVQVARKRAEEALRLTNEQLEHRVETRTAELSQLNAKLASEIVERRRSEAEMKHIAHHDALTGLANRVLFQDCLRKAMDDAEENGEAVAVLCLDLDRFKEVNDTFGHPAGDMLLRSVAQRLLSAVRVEDTVARMSGDEFAIIQPRPATANNPDSTEALARRLLDVFQEPFQIDAEVFHCGVSIGAALLPFDATTADDLLKSADIALYQAKSEGGGSYRRFDADMSAALELRRGFEQDLRLAVQRNEFELHYQPLVDIDTQSVFGCEALIRWRHPIRGFVQPAEFIPIAESSGLIVEIGEWILRTACAEAAHWPSSIKVAVNLSPVQLTKNGLVEAVTEALSAARLDPRRLELEIIESTLLENTEPVLQTLWDLKKLGIEIVMDDFGTGYSSLGYLRKFPFDKIKVDRSFVTDMASSTESTAIVRAVVGLASGLGMTTVAEGVETAEQLGSLQAEGCEQAQGFYFSKPRPAAEIRAMFEAARQSRPDVEPTEV